MLGSAQSLMTPELAEFFSAYLREVLPTAPPASQRSTGEWLLEQLAAYGSAERGGLSGHGLADRGAAGNPESLDPREVAA